MGYVISLDFQVFFSGKTPYDSPEFRKELKTLCELKDGSKVTDWEKRHIKAVELLADGYLHGYYSMCLVETYSLDNAEKEGKKGLELDPTDIMAAHSLAHVYEMEGRYDEGIQFMESTVKDWEADYEGALNIFDNQVYPRAMKQPTPLNIADSSALLKRLEMEGIHVGGRWQSVNEICRIQTSEKNNFIFFEVHYMIASVGAKQKVDIAKILDDAKELIEDDRDSFNKIAKREIGLKIYESLMAYDEGNYAKVVDILYPSRYKIEMMTGSIPQRDIIHQLLIHSAILSPVPRHNKIARCLLNVRKAELQNSEMTDRLIQKALASK
ncbi:hypothetical protein LSH36_45g16088 [Paralvinella palmiformis]|uniref:Tetratricopeptide repeat protein 38 n=1 Tax=Paralvinella palmiformis TaxID=53620 RepID=A0AAD9K6W2_9ANNE|nr:hypothetical protein LSH36_45g16088 [Paralvinella palmiformis]